MSRLDRKMVPSISNTANFFFLATWFFIYGQRTTRMVLDTSGAILPTVVNEAVGQLEPFFLWKERHEVLLDLRGILMPRQVEAACEAVYVRVHRYPLHDTIRIPQNDVCGLSPNARDTHHLRHRLWQLPIELSVHHLCGCEDVLRLIPIKSGLVNVLLKLSWSRANICIQRAVFFEEFRCYFVHFLVRTLCRKLYRDK